MTDATPTPRDYMRNALGHLVPTSMVKPIDRARNEIVLEWMTHAHALHDQLRVFKQRVFEDVLAFADLSAEEYGAKLGGRKGNITLYSYDGAYKIQLATADNIVFDERLQAAKALIDACISEWSQGSRPEIMVLVQQAFQTDKEGKLNTGRILGLRRLDIKDQRWVTAMNAIGDSVQVVGSKQYIRFYERVGDTDQYVPVSLDIASVS